MVSQASRIGRGLPLTFRITAVLLVATFFVALLVALLGAERNVQERTAEQRQELTAFAGSLAERVAPAVERADLMRLAVLAASARDLTDSRVLLLDRRGRVLVDTALVLGDRTLGLLAHNGPFERAVESPAQDWVFEALAPVRMGGEVVGEVRLQRADRESTAGFSWALFGITFLSSLSLVAVAAIMSHHWLTRVRRATNAVLSLAAGEVGEAPDGPATGELQDLQQALAELDRGMNEGLSRVAEGFVAMATHVVDSLERRGLVPPGHGERTSRYAGVLADRLGLLPEDRRELELAARLHDLGKMWVRPSILHKRGAGLDDVERESIKQHPGRGAEALDCLPSLRRVSQMIRHHHEKYDGTGFPDGLRGDGIPLGARILAIADAYDQLTSCQISGDTLSWPEALDQLREDRGENFDPWLLDMFEEEIRISPLPARPAHPVMISAAGVAPYKAAEVAVREEDYEDLQRLTEQDLELMLEDVPPEETP